MKIRLQEGATPIEKNVIVTDELGEKLGETYPKRAKGLIKNGRARYVSDGEICLNTCPPINLEDNIMENLNKLYFNAREWSFNKDCTDNVGDRNFINDFNGKLVEVYTIGSWQWQWTEILTKQLTLEKNSEYTFTFWLNGGENDRYDETCQFQILFNNDYEGKYVYKLNRDYIKPVKRYKGWKLFEIPFTTGDNEYTQLRFVSCRAIMTVMASLDKEAYIDLPDDEPVENKPQQDNNDFSDNMNFNGMQSNNYSFTGFDFMSMVKDKMMSEINYDDIKDNIMNEIDFDEISETFSEGLTTKIINDIKASFNDKN